MSGLFNYKIQSSTFNVKEFETQAEKLFLSESIEN